MSHHNDDRIQRRRRRELEDEEAEQMEQEAREAVAKPVAVCANCKQSMAYPVPVVCIACGRPMNYGHRQVARR